jgi:hypothetical protein
MLHSSVECCAQTLNVAPELQMLHLDFKCCKKPLNVADARKLHVQIYGNTPFLSTENLGSLTLCNISALIATFTTSVQHLKLGCNI